MFIVTITDDAVNDTINGFLAGILESITCSGETSIELDSYYEIYRDWVKLDGSTASLWIKGSELQDAWWKYGSGQQCKMIDRYEEKGNTTFKNRLYARIKGLAI